MNRILKLEQAALLIGCYVGIAVALIGTGWYTSQPYVLLAGIILLGHSAMDRIFGYGLKYVTSFQDTHLGKIGNKVN